VELVSDDRGRVRREAGYPLALVAEDAEALPDGPQRVVDPARVPGSVAKSASFGSRRFRSLGLLAPGMPVGFQNSATVSDLGFLRGPFILVEEAAEDGSALDPYLGEVSDTVIRHRRAESPAAMRAAAVVVGLVLGEDLP
jgi:hypothetical protein